MALPLLILLLAFAPPALFSFFVAVVVFLALLEFNRMGLKEEDRVAQWISAGAGAAFVPVLYLGLTGWLWVMAAVLLLCLATFYLFFPGELTTVHHRFGWLCLGLLYIAVLLAHLVPLRQLDDGRQWIFLTLVVVMCCDTAAYVVGSRIGKTKLYPLISPNKSVEGAAAGVAGAMVGAILAKLIFFSSLGIIGAIMVGLVLGIAGQIGDLFESMLKRACGVKDSGALIPGHGGVLDRLDSLLFAFPLVYYGAYCVF